MKFIALLLLTACGPLTTTRTLEDVGDACHTGDTVTLTFAGCLSSSCDTLVSADCTATLQGGVVTVRGTAVITSTGTECTADCGLITADCDAPTVTEPDTTILVVGDDDGGPVWADAFCPD